MKSSSFPLTLAQSDIYFDQLRRSSSPLYNVGGYISLGRIDVERLTQAHARIVCEKSIFGLRIMAGEGDVAQYISFSRTASLLVVDFSGRKRSIEEADEWLASLFEVPFDSIDAELFHAYLVKIADDNYRYVGVAHHLMMDGWGFSNWATLLCRLYSAPLDSLEIDTPWQVVALDDQRYASSEKCVRDSEYWRECLSKTVPLLFPPRYAHAFVSPTNIPSRRKIIGITRAQFNEIKEAAESAGAGVVQHFLAMLAVYLGRHFGRERVMFGLASHNRRNYRAKQMLGVFAGMTPLSIDVHKEQNTFGSLVRDILRQQKADFRHQRYPLGRMLHDLAECDNRRVLYDVAFNYLRLAGGLSFAGIGAKLVYVSHNHEPTPLMITLCERGQCENIQLQIDYNLAYLNDNDIALLVDRFSFLLHHLQAAYEMPIARLPILPPAEVSRLVTDFGRGPVQSISEQCIHHLFEQQVERVPDAVAVGSRGESLTYRELNNRANAVARHLMSLGLKPESLVGIYMARGADIVTGVLGILKAGAAYVPLDQLWPSQRIRTTLENSRIHIVLTQHALAESVSFPGVACINIEEAQQWDGPMNNNPAPTVVGLSSLNLAYVIHTSGSTGTPKGVQICHANAVALLQWAMKAYTAQELSKVLASTSLGFDLSVFEMFAPLSVGGECVIVKDALELIATPVNVSLISTVPSAIKILIENDAIPPNVSMINLAGEALPERVVNDLLGAFKCRKVRNLYGPSEDTTYSTCAEFTETLSNAPEIGWALPGTRFYVVSLDGDLAPAGAVGELYIVGNRLARGYLNRPDLTADRFVPNPFSSEGDRMYRTGDLVRYGENGALHYVGRLDDQLKIRGLRIEPGEIEMQLEALDEVKTAVVLASGSASSERYLAAFVERTPPIGTTINHLSVEAWIEELRQALEIRLPRYMVPRSIIVLESMPLTANGKADRKALLALQHEPKRRKIYVPPDTPTEARLVGIYSELLGIDKEQISVTASLFELGLHSLLLIKLASHLRSQMGVPIPVNRLFNIKNCRDLAKEVDIEIMLQAIHMKMNNAAIEVEGYLE